MGNGCIKYELLDENQMITESRDLKGQYNDYINYGLFDLMLCKKIKIDEPLVHVKKLSKNLNIYYGQHFP